MSKNLSAASEEPFTKASHNSALVRQIPRIEVLQDDCRKTLLASIQISMFSRVARVSITGGLFLET